MKFSDSSPQNLKQQNSENSIKVGSVIRMFVFDTTPPKTKLFIIIGLDPENICLASVYINSKLTKYAKRNPKIKRQHVLIKKTEQHSFLKHDSYIDCAELKIKNIAKLKEKIEIDPSIVRGTLEDSVIEQITRKLSVAENIKPKHKKRFNLNRFSDFD
jgi:hypothetical protein